jgi:CBS domain containing-hemolysin-like protein
VSAGAVWVTVLLLLLNAFFVGAEFAAMAARRSTLEPLAANGSRRAQVCLDALEQMGSLLACAQLGITVCSVLLGAISEAALHHALEPVVHHLGLPTGVTDGLALALALLIVVYLHVVIGEMIPKNLALAGPERSALILVPVLLFITRALRPIISVMESLAKSLVRLFRVEPKDEITSAFTVEEVEHILAESHHEGLIEEGQHGLVGAALEFSDKDAVDVAVALSDLVTLPLTATPDDVERLGAVVPDGPAYETTGGFVMAELGRVPTGGDTVHIPGWEITVLAMDGMRADRLRFVPVDQAEDAGQGDHGEGSPLAQDGQGRAGGRPVTAGGRDAGRPARHDAEGAK